MLQIFLFNFKFDCMKILVTGANGQLGMSLQRLSKDYPHSFIFADRNKLNICQKEDVESFIAEQKPDIVINAAAYTGVDKAEDEQDFAFLVNAVAVKYLAEACQKNNVRLIHISTDYVFNGKHSTPYSTQDITDPKGVYGKTKLEGEKLALQYCERTNIIRTSWLYSEYRNNFVKTMIRLGKERPSLNVVFDQTGTPCYCGDLAKAIMVLAENESNEKLFHFSNEGVCSWYDFAKKIMKICHLDCKVLPILSKDYPTKASRPEYSVLDKSLIKKTLNIEIPHWEEALEEMLVRNNFIL